MLVTILLILELFLLVLCAFGLYSKSTNALCKSKRRLDGATCLVTGGTSGIGLQVAIDFASRGGRVIVACPVQEEGESAKQQIIEETGNNNVVFKFLDLASLDSVRKFAADIIQNENRLDILMNNAGVGGTTKLTEDGLNALLQINYFGHFLLTILLLPLLKKTGIPSIPSRIINTCSLLHSYGNLNLKKMTVPQKNMRKMLFTYADSKLYLMLFSRELTKRLSGSNVVINCVDPGAVGTRIYISNGFSPFGVVFSAMLYIFSKTPFEGAQTLIHAAIDDEAGKVSGTYFKECTIHIPSLVARDDFAAKTLWEESMACVKLSIIELGGCLK